MSAYACAMCGRVFRETEVRGKILHCDRVMTRLVKPSAPADYVAGSHESFFKGGYVEHGLYPGQRVAITSVQQLDREMKRAGKVFVDVKMPGRAPSSQELRARSEAHDARRRRVGGESRPVLTPGQVRDRVARAEDAARRTWRD